MRGDVYPHIEVPGWPAPLAGRALALELDPLAVGDAGRDPGLDRPGAHRPPAPGAHRAGIVDHQPAAPAGPARLGESEAVQVLAGLPGSLAGRTGPRPCARLGPGSVTRLARPLPGRAAVRRCYRRWRHR